MQYSRSAKLVDALAQRFNDAAFCDVTIFCPDGEAFHCVGALLRAQSVVFEKMLGSEMIEATTKQVHMKEAPTDVIELMLKFLHSGECKVDVENVILVHDIANRYEVEALVGLCKDYMKNHVTLCHDNVVGLYMHACLLRSDDFKTQCKDYIIEQGNVISQESFNTLDYPTLCDFLASAKGDVSEAKISGLQYYEIVCKAIHWLQDQDDGSKLVGDLLNLIDLGEMCRRDVTRLCAIDLVQQSPQISMQIVKALALRDPVCIYETSKRGDSQTFETPAHQGFLYVLVQGGKGFSTLVNPGGKGAIMGASFQLPSKKLSIIFGEGGTSSVHGGGAAAVWVDGMVGHLLVAGGGGSGGGDYMCPGRDAHTHASQHSTNVTTPAANNGRGCVKVMSNPTMFKICHEMCSGGVGLGAGGGGFCGGPGSAQGGHGGSSFCHPIGLNPIATVGNNRGPSVSVWMNVDNPLLLL